MNPLQLAKVKVGSIFAALGVSEATWQEKVSAAPSHYQASAPLAETGSVITGTVYDSGYWTVFVRRGEAQLTIAKGSFAGSATVGKVSDSIKMDFSKLDFSALRNNVNG